jgi:hypothetical protein
MVPTTYYLTIQSALANLPDGGVVFVAPGTYYGPLFINRDVTIKSWGPGVIHLYPSGSQLQLAPGPLIRIQHGVTARLADMHIHQGTIYAAPESVEEIPSILELSSVIISHSPPSGAIAGFLHLKGNNLNIHHAQGDGINIRGTADLRQVTVHHCTGRGVVIDNSVSPPSVSPAGEWIQQFCGSVAHNGIGGMFIENNEIDWFPIIGGDIMYNYGSGIHLRNAWKALIIDMNIFSQLGTREGGAGIVVQGPGEVLIAQCLIFNNGIGVTAQGCDTFGTTRVRFKDTVLGANGVSLVIEKLAECAEPAFAGVDLVDEGGLICLPPETQFSPDNVSGCHVVSAPTPP